MTASKITEVELDFDQMTLERLPSHVVEQLRERKASEHTKPRITHAIEMRMPVANAMLPCLLSVPEQFAGKRVRITLEVIE